MMYLLLLPISIAAIYLFAITMGMTITEIGHSKAVTYGFVLYGSLLWGYFLFIHLVIPLMDWLVSSGL